MNSLEVKTCAGLFPNSDGTFTYKGSVYNIALGWRYFVEREICVLHLHISGPVSIRITFLVVNWMLYAAEFKIVIHFDAIDFWVTRWCMSQVTVPIKNYG